ncbi:MAG: hypothetical protein WCL04_04970 [Verrucomicrobiota bacterium]
MSSIGRCTPTTTLCAAFQIEFTGQDHHCERLLVQEAFRHHRAGKLLVAAG